MSIIRGYSNILSGPEPDAYRDELERERLRTLGVTPGMSNEEIQRAQPMTEDQLRADLANSGSSVARHNACLARLQSLQTRLPEGQAEHYHAHHYDPMEREFGRDE